MISKERLEELIKEKRTIYWKFAKIKPSSWSRYTIMGNMIVKGNLKEMYSLNDLFETKEDFEWYREFGCIERTERLHLPTWEEISKEFKNINRFGSYAVIDTAGVYMDIFVDNYANKFIVLTTQPRMPLTRENYLLACKKCKELFLLGNK